ESRPRMGDVAQRPESLVGEAQIESRGFFLRQPYAPERVLWMVRRHAQPAMLVGGFAVGVARGLGDPGSIAGAQNGFQSGDQSAGRHGTLDSVRLAEVLIGFPIGNRHQAAAIQPRLHEHAQPVGGPVRIGGVAQAGFLFRRGPRRRETQRQARYFALERLENRFSRKRRGRHFATHAQFSQPQRHALQRNPQSPSNREERDRENQNRLQADAGKRPAPGLRDALVDERRVVKYRQRAQQSRAGTQRKRRYVHQDSAKLDEFRTGSGILGDRAVGFVLGLYTGRRRHSVELDQKSGGDRHRKASRIVNGMPPAAGEE